MADKEAAKAPRVRKVSIPITTVIGMRDELLAIDVSGHDVGVKLAITAVADKLLAMVS